MQQMCYGWQLLLPRLLHCCRCRRLLLLPLTGETALLVAAWCLQASM
jgi:hypothetical protein